MKQYVKIDTHKNHDLIMKGLKWFTRYSLKRHPVLLSTALKSLSKAGIAYEVHNIPDASVMAVIDGNIVENPLIPLNDDTIIFDEHWIKDVNTVSGDVTSPWPDNDGMTPIVINYDLEKCLNANDSILLDKYLGNLTFLSDVKNSLEVLSDVNDHLTYWNPDEKHWWSVAFASDGTFNFYVDLHSAERINALDPSKKD